MVVLLLVFLPISPAKLLDTGNCRAVIEIVKKIVYFLFFFRVIYSKQIYLTGICFVHLVHSLFAVKKNYSGVKLFRGKRRQ